MSTPALATSYALLVGIGAYRYLRKLARTATDARDMREVLLAQGIPDSNLAILLDQDASKAAICQRLALLAQVAGAVDTVVLFFSGHGAHLLGGPTPGDYLCPVDARVDDPRNTMVSSSEFADALRAIQARRLVVFLDACHAGGIGEPKDAGIEVKGGLTEAAYAELAGGEGRIIIASCRPEESSWELPGMRNGLFSHHLLAGLRGGAARSDGTVWISQLFGYVYEQVSQTGHQHPYQKAAGEDFAVSVVASTRLVGESAMGALTAPTAIEVNPTALRHAMRKAYDREEFVLLCNDLGVDYDDIRGDTLPTKMMYLIDRMVRHNEYDRLIWKVIHDRPSLVQELRGEGHVGG